MRACSEIFLPLLPSPSRKALSLLGWGVVFTALYLDIYTNLSLPPPFFIRIYMYIRPSIYLYII